MNEGRMQVPATQKQQNKQSQVVFGQLVKAQKNNDFCHPDFLK
jgi:hypothetical protein